MYTEIKQILKEELNERDSKSIINLLDNNYLTLPEIRKIHSPEEARSLSNSLFQYKARIKKFPIIINLFCTLDKYYDDNSPPEHYIGEDSLKPEGMLGPIDWESQGYIHESIY